MVSGRDGRGESGVVGVRLIRGMIAQSDDERLVTTMNVQLLENVVDMLVDSSLGDEERVGDLAAAHSLAHQFEDLALARGELCVNFDWSLHRLLLNDTPQMPDDP